MGGIEDVGKLEPAGASEYVLLARRGTYLAYEGSPSPGLSDTEREGILIGSWLVDIARVGA